ncbi:MAG TPA: DUF998 domain-containing protein [Rubrobacter sp.]|jgi:hypothetical protein|nr:DUF998 domain-containing protein [Rubrobacter sp.]
MIITAAIAGMMGSALFGIVLLALSALEYDFMLGIGWRPVADPAGAWPSGLALGPYGLAQVANFVVSGLLLAFFSLGLHLGATNGRGSPLGPAFLFVAGTAISLMGFETDPIRRIGPRSLHGLIHDAAYVIFVLAFMAALFSLWRRFEEHSRWRAHARYTLATGILAVLLLLLPGVAYYAFIITLLAWIEATAIRLWRLS